MRSTCLLAVALAGVVAGCSEEWSALMPPPGLFKLDTWTRVPEGQWDVRAKVGDVLCLPLGPGTTYSQLGWMKVIVNYKPVDTPDFEGGEETSSLKFHADRPGQYRVEVRREIVRRIDPDDPDAGADGKAPEDPPGPATTFTRNADPKWPPRVWNVTVSE